MRILLPYLVLAVAIAMPRLAAITCKHEDTGFKVLYKVENRGVCRLYVLQNEFDKKLQVYYDEAALVQEYAYNVMHSNGVIFNVSIQQIDLNRTSPIKPRPRAVDPSAPHRFGRNVFWWVEKNSVIEIYENGSGGYWIELTNVLPPAEKMRNENVASQTIPKENMDTHLRPYLLPFRPNGL